MQSTGKVINYNRLRKSDTSATKQKKPKILFVDDEERILNTMQALFRRQYDTTTTTDGYHALELLKKDHYHLLVSDQRMPIMPGVDLLRQAKEVSPDTVRILLTGFSDLAAIIGSVNDGEVFRFLNKPWNTLEFVSTVNEAVKIGIELQESAANDAAPTLPKTPETQKDIEASTKSDIEPVSPFPQAANVYQENIIVLNGDEDMLSSVRHMLAGCKVFDAKSHDEAIDLMMDHEIGVIVSNVNDDHDQALAFFSLLKREHPQVVSVLLANSGDSSTLIHLINNARVFRYMFKPIRKRLMGRYLHSAIEQYQKFKVAPTLLKQQVVQEKAPVEQVDNTAINTTESHEGQKKPAPSTQGSSAIVGKMRKIRSFFSRLVKG